MPRNMDTEMDDLQPRVLRTKQPSLEQPGRNIQSLSRFRPYFLPLLLFVATLTIFANTMNADLLESWDDNIYISQNPYVINFSLGNLVDVWTKSYNGEYIPVTLTNFIIEYQLWGAGRAGYHVVNVILHGLNGVLVYLLIKRLYGSSVVAFVAALLFIAHPLQVETVAWVSQRKNLLSLCFFLLAFLSHMSSLKKKSTKLLIIAWICFLLSMLSKPAAVLTPILFFLYDFLQKRRTASRLVFRNLPYFIMGIIGAVIMYQADKHWGGIRQAPGDGLWENVQIMARAFWDYFASIFAPFNLNNLYIYSLQDLRDGDLGIWLGFGVLLLLVALAVTQPFGRRITIFAVLWIVVFMLPVANIIPIAAQHADRFMYFPLVAIFLLVGIFFDKLWQRFQNIEARYALVAAAGIIIAILGTTTIQRNTVWKNSETLWKDHLEEYPTSVTGLINLSVYYYQHEDFGKARDTLATLLRLYPNNFQGNQLLGNIALLQQDYQNAIVLYQRAIAANPNNHGLTDDLGAAYLQLGVSAFDQGDYATALGAYLEALKLIPNEPILHNNVGFTLSTLGEYEQALAAYYKALELDPFYARAWVNLGNTAIALQDYTLARDAYDSALRLNTQLDAQGYSNYCLALGELRENQEAAINACNQALTLAPDNGLILGRAAHVLLLFGLPADALPIAQRAVEAAPNMSLAYRTLGDALAGTGRIEEARAAYEQALAIDPENTHAQAGLNSLTGGQ